MVLVTADPDLPSRWTAATVYDDMWVDPDGDPRDVGTSPVGERETLIQYLHAYRLTLRMKCDGLTPEQLARRSVPPSTLSLLGLVRHLAEVERSWTRRVMLGEDASRLWGEPGRDVDFEGAVGRSGCGGPCLHRLAGRDGRDGRARRRNRGSRDDVGEHDCQTNRTARGPRPPHRGVRAPLWPRRPTSRAHRRAGRSVGNRTG